MESNHFMDVTVKLEPGEIYQVQNVAKIKEEREDNVDGEGNVNFGEFRGGTWMPSKEDCVVIKTVESYPSLWKPDLKQYGNAEIWQQVATQVLMTVGDAITKWNEIRIEHKREWDNRREQFDGRTEHPMRFINDMYNNLPEINNEESRIDVTLKPKSFLESCLQLEAQKLQLLAREVDTDEDLLFFKSIMPDWKSLGGNSKAILRGNFLQMLQE